MLLLMMCVTVPVLGNRVQLPAEVLDIFLAVFCTEQNLELT